MGEDMLQQHINLNWKFKLLYPEDSVRIIIDRIWYRYRYQIVKKSTQHLTGLCLSNHIPYLTYK
jgi:hypothetical protein